MDDELGKRLAEGCRDVSATLFNMVSAVQAANAGNEKAKGELAENHKALAMAWMQWTLALVDVAVAALKEEQKGIVIARPQFPGEKIN